MGLRGRWAGVSFLFIYLGFRCRTGAACELLATFGHIWSHGTSDHKGPLHHPRKHPVNTLLKKGRYGRLETLPLCKRAAHVCTSTPYQGMPPNSKSAMFNSGQSWGDDLRNVSSPRNQYYTLINSFSLFIPREVRAWNNSVYFKILQSATPPPYYLLQVLTH